MDLGLKGKVVLVAAASKGLGRAIASEFAREGASLAICARDDVTVRATADDIARESGSSVLAVATDLGTADGCASFVDAATAAYGAIDVLVVNAGGPPPGRFDDLNDEQWQQAVDLTLFSAVRLTRLALPALRASAGNIVFMTSLAARQPAPILLLSNAVRAGVHGLAKSLATDLARDRVRVNAVLPGLFATDRTVRLDAERARREGITPEESRARVERSSIPLGRYGDPSEFAAAVVFLASARASYITGASLQIDGGTLESIF